MEKNLTFCTRIVKSELIWKHQNALKTIKIALKSVETKQRATLKPDSVLRGPNQASKSRYSSPLSVSEERNWNIFPTGNVFLSNQIGKVLLLKKPESIWKLQNALKTVKFALKSVETKQRATLKPDLVPRSSAGASRDQISAELRGTIRLQSRDKGCNETSCIIPHHADFKLDFLHTERS